MKKKSKVIEKPNPNYLDLAEKAMKLAVAGVVKKHIESGRPLHVWQDGKVVAIPANQLGKGAKKKKIKTKSKKMIKKKTKKS